MARQRIRSSDLASKLGVSNQWVSRHLNGQTPLSLTDTERICAALGIPARQVFAVEAAA